MKELEYLYFKDEASFRDWLNINHRKSPGIWLVFYKKHTGKESIKHHEALDTALCFGWIDSIIKKIDELSYAIKFTPRVNISKWSEFNKRRVDELIKNGKMTEAGLKKTDCYLKTGKIERPITGTAKKKPDQIVIPDFIIDEFAKNEPALSNFYHLAPTYQRNYILWITNAIREITKKNRLEESIRLLRENKKLGLK